jgi:hypothetical protein
MNLYVSICLLVPVLWLTSCSPNLTLTVHDEGAAALVASNFLHTAFYQHKPDDAYNSAHPQFKAGASKTNFTAGIQKVQTSLSPTNFVITDYSTWGTEELVGIYGNCQTSNGAVLHFRCLLMGTKSKGYGVGRFDCSTTLPQKTGANVPFKTSIALQRAQPDGAANGSELPGSVTNRTTAAAASGR